jgi:uncharacterized protein YjbI with pentapeptide repeats
MRVRLAVVGAVAVVLVAPRASATPSHVLSPAQIKRDLISGRGVIDHDATIQGRVNLTRYAGKIEGPFVCNRCTFDGGISAPHALFEREVDLSGSMIKRDLILHGTLFREPALFNQTVFGGNADFAFAVFDDLAVFRESTFEAAADFRSAQFRSVARFGDTAFNRASSFSEVIFAGTALFPRVVFTRDAEFSDAVFAGVSDFRDAFFQRGKFVNANLVGRAEFGGALINQELDFSGTRFGSDALFIHTVFGIRPPHFGKGVPALQFGYAVVGGRIDLQDAELKRSADFNVVSAGSMSFDGITYDPASKLLMTEVGATDVSLDLADVRHLKAGSSAEARAILHTAEETAKSAGNLGLANDLHYRIQEIARGDDVWPRRIADHAFYRTVAGYFVRPFRPLYWLLGLVIFAAALRALRAPPATDEAAPQAKGGQAPATDEATSQAKDGQPGRVRRAWFKFAHALEYTLTRRGEVPAEPKPLRRLELTVYAVLLACFVLALANTNPTLRDMVDAIV